MIKFLNSSYYFCALTAECAAGHQRMQPTFTKKFSSQISTHFIRICGYITEKLTDDAFTSLNERMAAYEMSVPGSA